MSQRVRHSKIKNTGILFELLSRQITVDVMNDNAKSKSVEILKKFFNEGTELGKENQLYQVLLKENYNSPRKAEKLLEVVLKSREKLQNKKLRTEKYNLIKKIKENYKVEDFFNVRIPNYKVYASIYKSFLAETTPVFDPADEVNSTFTIMEHITRNKTKPRNTDNKTLAEFKKEDTDLRLLSYQLMVDNFNGKYKTLNSMQRNLLKEYVNNISNTNSLREFINGEVKKVKEILTKSLPKITDKITKIKLKESIAQADTLTKGKIVRDKQVVSLMRYYSLIGELRNVVK
ncbi:hypothetical protein HN385_07600 [archaeon]|nr:hypothetical protein [archaeon]MBT4732228.1 hypothetical protein [Candidatus Woesearchaeota archaeon]MBT5758858.1 hypothetical protein [Candidatus Neomarinimicrobiota bacterium]MBT7557259.1 hypothetical protein [Candidatus Woesearchaeota archaeon]